MSDTNPLRGISILISGAGIAGPALAYWLGRYGADVTVVEIAPALRASGFAVDFRGPTHLEVLRKMCVLDELRHIQTHGGAMSCVDEHSREIFRLPAEFAGGDIEVYRRDLSRVLYEHSAGRAEYLFGDAITNLAQTDDAVHVDFAKSASRTVDLVVGADGLHSGVRRLAFGAEARFARHLGFYLAAGTCPTTCMPGPQHSSTTCRAGWPASVPTCGTQTVPSLSSCSRHPSSTTTGATSNSTRNSSATRSRACAGTSRICSTPSATRRTCTSTRSAGLPCPAGQPGRVALLGDAAWGVTLGGMGVGTGIVGAYVLAGELAAAGGDHRTAFTAYENRMRGYAARWQRGANPGQFLAPPTATRLRMRNTMFKTRLIQRLLVSSTRSLATDVGLPDYVP